MAGEQTEGGGFITTRVGARAASAAPARQAKLFFLIGPLRTGSSLMARCIDDHPDALCLCESEVNRALFAPHYWHLHHMRMLGHGAKPGEVMKLLDRKVPGNVGDFMRWHVEALNLLRDRLGKPGVTVIGDKSPDYFAAPALVAAMRERFPLIYTVRDPRAIVRSIWAQDVREDQKEERLRFLIANIACWRGDWDRPNLLVSRYEDLVRTPEAAMARVYAHLGLAPSTRFLEPFERVHPARFLWKTAIDWESGVRQAFDPARAQVSDGDIAPELLARLDASAEIAEYRERFGYT